MIRAARPGDAPALRAFLAGRERAAMFPLSALHGGGLMPPETPLDGPGEMHGWLVEEAGRIEGFLGLSGGGHLMPFWPGAAWRDLRPHLAGRRVATVIVPDGQAGDPLAALGLADAPIRHRDEEPGFVLDLRDLRMPDVTGFSLAPLDRHLPLVRRWRGAYLGEIFGVTGAEAEQRAADDVARWVAADSHRLLMRGDDPVALSGFNARIPGVVQIGGVWTPPEARGQGLARRMVALHLDQARGQGVTRAVLFAANDAAAAAYRAIGFVREGSMGIVELAQPVTVTP
ncbi:MAG: GNAT family N-acetyltransferase [Paracoccaceae bacterium]